MKADETVICNLCDAGCGEELVSRFGALGEAGDTAAQLRLLEEYRKGLLGELHCARDKLRCLDYLIYRIRGGRCPDGCDGKYGKY